VDLLFYTTYLFQWSTQVATPRCADAGTTAAIFTKTTAQQAMMKINHNMRVLCSMTTAHRAATTVQFAITR
jgi:hypothetical protein